MEAKRYLPFLIKVFYCMMLVLLPGRRATAYSVLSHEAIVDAAWEKSIKPALLQKYPATTTDELLDAHAYAYGGAVTPDIGYYPLGCPFFTDLLHYVRSGDMVSTLLEEAQDVQEYAFALGVLCHYNADKYGHPLGVNAAAPLVYPKVREKFGPAVTYEEDPLSHIRTEFGFDVLQTARGNYAPEAYHDFIGFKINRPVLDRAFARVYGMELNDVYKHFNLSVQVCKLVTLHMFPAITKVAWARKKKDIQAAHPGITRRKFSYRIHLQRYYSTLGYEHDKPGLALTGLSYAMRALPKVGPLKKYKIEIPGPDAELIFAKSFDTVLANYARSVDRLKQGQPCLNNIDYDTGKETEAGEYHLADKGYATLLLKLHERKYTGIDPALRRNLLAYYSNTAGKPKRMHQADWQKVQTALHDLQQAGISQAQ